MWRAITFLKAIGSAAALLAGCNVPVVAPSPLSGEAIAFGAGPGGARDACFTCHGLNGEGDGTTPGLAGLSSGYMLKQLKDYAGHWRDEKTMTPIAARLSDADRIAVSDYYAGLPMPQPDAASTDLTGLALFTTGDAARNLEPCAVCHTPDGKKFGEATPILAGQTAPYIRDQLIAWKESRRRNDARDVMGAIARKLTFGEIDSLARYAGALP